MTSGGPQDVRVHEEAAKVTHRRPEVREETSTKEAAKADEERRLRNEQLAAEEAALRRLEELRVRREREEKESEEKELQLKKRRAEREEQEKQLAFLAKQHEERMNKIRADRECWDQEQYDLYQRRQQTYKEQQEKLEQAKHEFETEMARIREEQQERMEHAARDLSRRRVTYGLSNIEGFGLHAGTSGSVSTVCPPILSPPSRYDLNQPFTEASSSVPPDVAA